MALKFHPKAGTILLCNYNTGFVVPEMVKRRPVVVISPRLRFRDRLCTVVPFSETTPDRILDYHYQLTLERPLPPPFDANPVWVKCDMLATVTFSRLDLIRTGRDPQGKRKYLTPILPDHDLKAIRACVLRALGMDSLT